MKFVDKSHAFKIPSYGLPPMVRIENLDLRLKLSLDHFMKLLEYIFDI